MSGLEAISFLFLPIAAAVLSWNDRCGFPDANQSDDDDDERLSYHGSPRDACPEIICSSSSSSLDDSRLSYFRPDNTLLSLTTDSSNGDDDADDDYIYKFDVDGSYYSL